MFNRFFRHTIITLCEVNLSGFIKTTKSLKFLSADLKFRFYNCSGKQASFLLSEYSSFSQQVYFIKLHNPMLIQC